MADQPGCKAPHGMESYDLGGTDDLGGLSKEQQARLNQKKIKTRMENEKYLRGHPEVDVMLSEFLKEIFLKRPEDISEFAAEYFNNPVLPDTIAQLLNQRQDKLSAMKLLQMTNTQGQDQ